VSVRPRDRLEHVAGAQQLEDARGRHHVPFHDEPPVDGHELDEAHVDGPFTGKVDEGVELVFDPLEQEHVELDGLEPGGERRVQAGERVTQARAARHGGVPRRVEAVDADVHAAQPVSAQVVGEARQQDAVGRQGEVRDTLDLRQHTDQVGTAVAHERLPAGDTHLADPTRDGDTREGDELLIRQDVVVGPRQHALRRHAVRTPQVAAVGDRQAQVVDAPCTRGRHAHARSVVHAHGPGEPGGRRAEGLTAT